MQYKKPDIFYYRLTQAASQIFATCVFRRQVLRNEIKNAKGPFVVIANHQAAYDFVNLIGICRRPMSFVISNSFYQSLPIKGILNKLGVIPKQQFQTSSTDLKKIRSVILAGEPVAIYPAGLMCEDGLPTPTPTATGKLLKWLGVDVYMAKVSGTYFAMPKWASGFRPGKTTLDVYKLFSKEDLEAMDIDEVWKQTKQALQFDAYREQEQLRVKYRKGDQLQGLENVLYRCPHCGTDYSIAVKDGNTLYCKNCGYAQTSDKYGFLHKSSAVGPELRYVSDWSRLIYDAEKETLSQGIANVLSAKTRIHMVDTRKNKYAEAGHGTVTLNGEHFLLEGVLHQEPIQLRIPIAGFPTLPFSPGKYIEIQDGPTIYRCVLEDGKLAMKFINMVKIFHEINHPEKLPEKSRCHC